MNLKKWQIKIVVPRLQFRMHIQQTQTEATTRDNPLKQIARKLEELFRPRSMFNNAYLRTKMEESFKCYISYSDLLQHTEMKRFINAISEQYSNVSCQGKLGTLMFEAVRFHSKHLWANFNGIRPMKPYTLKDLTPICFSQFDRSNNCENFQVLLQRQSPIINVTYSQHKDTAVVYSQNPEALLQLNGYKWYDWEQQRPTNILDYIDYSSDQDSFTKKKRLERHIKVFREEEYNKNQSLVQNMKAKQRFERIYHSSVDKVHPCIEEVKIVKKHKIKRLADMQEHMIQPEIEEKYVGLVDFSQQDRKCQQIRQKNRYFHVVLTNSKYDTGSSSEISSSSDN